MIRHDPLHELAELLRDYLAANPNACDTERGIADRWLAEAPLPPAPDLVREALGVLESEGLLERVACDDGRVEYFRVFLRRH